MVQTKLIPLTLAVLLCASCGHRMTWTKYVMDGHRTGVTAPNASNVAEALGTVKDGVYTSPNGTVFDGGSVVKVAEDMIEAQDSMASVKEVIGYATKEMNRHGADCELSNWIVDHIMVDVERITGKHVDVGIINSGGIRVDMPQGDVILDDILSMFPFKNYLSYVALKGSDLQAIFDYMASTMVQPMGGVRIKVDHGHIDSLLVGGAPLDTAKVYGVATIDFLLDGGDGLSIAKNCKELIITDCLMIDSMLPYVRSYAAEGKPIEYHKDGRIVQIMDRRPE